MEFSLQKQIAEEIEKQFKENLIELSFNTKELTLKDKMLSIEKIKIKEQYLEKIVYPNEESVNAYVYQMLIHFTLGNFKFILSDVFRDGDFINHLLDVRMKYTELEIEMLNGQYSIGYKYPDAVCLDLFSLYRTVICPVIEKYSKGLVKEYFDSYSGERWWSLIKEIPELTNNIVKVEEKIKESDYLLITFSSGIEFTVHKNEMKKNINKYSN